MQCWTAGAGLVDIQGSPTGLYVELQARQVIKPSMRAYRFTVFRTSASGPQRVYQLDVPQWPVAPRDEHLLPHEHVGARRVIGDCAWGKWSYYEVIEHFCEMTSIAFDPQLPDPFEFVLEG